jgi:hypothetical protein
VPVTPLSQDRPVQTRRQAAIACALGVLALALCWLPVLPLAAGAVAIAFGATARVKSAWGDDTARILASAGMLAGCIAIAVSLALTISALAGS